jgi:hypothetical protein
MRRAIASSAATIGAAVMLIAAAGQASADRAAPSHDANTFSGSCKISGTVAFDPRLTNTPQATTQQVQATGTCSGTFTGPNGQAHQLNDASVRYQAT